MRRVQVRIGGENKKGNEAGVTLKTVRKYWERRREMGSENKYLLGESGFQDGVGLEAIGQGAHEGEHGVVPRLIEAKGAHFRDGLVGGPVLEGDAVGSDENPGAIFAKFAMNENLLRRSGADEGEELRELRGGGIGETTNGNRDKMNAEGFGTRTFLSASVRRFAAQINDGGDAEFFELVESGKTRLRAAKELIGNFSSVVNTGKRHFFCERRGRRDGSGGLPKWN